MKKSLHIFLGLMVITGTVIFSCKQKTTSPDRAIGNLLTDQVDSFSTVCNQFRKAAEDPATQEKSLQNLFLQARLAYKKMEWAAEYFAPITARQVNGPPVPEVEMPGLNITDPAGFQMMEPCLFPHIDPSRHGVFLRQVDLMQSAAGQFQKRLSGAIMYDPLVFDAVKLEIYRLITLGITGFDNPLTLKSMAETQASLESLQQILEQYPPREQTDSLMTALDGAINYLRVNNDFNSFNRAEFIVRYMNPMTASLTLLTQELNIPFHKYNRLVNQDARTLFDTNTFNVNAYAPDRYFFINPEKIELGKTLFSDPLLSGNGNRSCQSCHQPALAFTDGLPKNKTLNQNGLLKRNTPTLINAALQSGLFDDLRVNSLEDQSITVVQSSDEMHGSMQTIAHRLWDSQKYRDLFARAFPKKDRRGIDTMEVMNAIGSYVRSLVQLNSRFDDFMRGNKTALNTQELQGFNLFMGKAKCGTCHFMPLFNGNFPPGYISMESEVIGVPETATKKYIDPDLGRYEIVPLGFLKHAFKTPTLRNVARTAPYMHNGVFSNLEQVVDFYNKGGGTGLGLAVENQTLPFDQLNLSAQEKEDIIAFMKSLNSH